MLAFVNWAFDADSVTTYRWLLLVLALGYALVSLLLRGPAPRHSEQMVNAAGLAVLAIALTGLVRRAHRLAVPFGSGGGEVLPNGWELVVFAAGCGLIAYGAVDRAPGPAYLGVANLLASSSRPASDVDETLLYWPLLILAARPRRDVHRPAPAQPAAARAERLHDRQRPARLAHGRGAGAARAR